MLLELPLAGRCTAAEQAEVESVPGVIAGDRRVVEAVEAIRRRWPTRPRVALVLGTGLNELSQHINAEAILPYSELPHFVRSTAIGHTGQLVCGHLDNVPIVTMEGRCHLYEGYSVEQVTFPIHVFAALGIDLVILTNASGGLNPQFATGDLMVVADHVWMGGGSGLGSGPWPVVSGQRAHAGHYPLATDHWPLTTPIYDRAAIELALAVGRRHGFATHQGVYVAVTGPNYETRAEYRMLRKIGGDVVGMSTVPEAVAAHRLGVKVFAVSTVTNVARPDAPRTVNAWEVIQAAKQAEAKVWSLVRELVGKSASKPDA